MTQAGMIISTTSLIPHTHRVENIEALVPLAITYICHLIWPFVLDPYFTTFTVSRLMVKSWAKLTTYSSSPLDLFSYIDILGSYHVFLFSPTRLSRRIMRMYAQCPLKNPKPSLALPRWLMFLLKQSS
jgi:hypothetical protein